MYIYICIFRDTYIHVHIGVYTWTPTRSLRTLRTPHTLRTLRSMLRRFVVQDGPWRLQWPSAASSRMVDLWDLSRFKMWWAQFYNFTVSSLRHGHVSFWLCSFWGSQCQQKFSKPVRWAWAMGWGWATCRTCSRSMSQVFVPCQPEPLSPYGVSGSSWDHLVHWDLEVESMLGVSFCGGPWRTRDVWRFAPPVHKKENPHGDPLPTRMVISKQETGVNWNWNPKKD